MKDTAPRYQMALIGVLLLINVVNYMDRSLIGILGETIRRDLSLSDTQLGLVAGGIFTLTYSLLGLPAARLADRGWGKYVILGSVLSWCLMTCMIGFVRNFAELAITRIGVALGEAGVLPASHAMITRNVSRDRRASAIGLLWVGGTIGTALAAILGGWAAARFGWRWTFVVLGAGGLLLVPLTALVMRGRETPRPEAAQGHGTTEPFGRVVRYIVSLRSYPLIWLGSATMFMAQSAYLVYAAPYFIRTYGLSVEVVGRYIGLTVGVGATVGVLVGGRLFDRLAKRSTSLAIRVAASSAMLSGVLAIVGWNSSIAGIAAVCLALNIFFYMLVTAPSYVMAQILVPQSMRSTSAALLNLGISAIGGALGPLLAGALSDLAKPSLGAKSLVLGLTVCAVVQMGRCLSFPARRQPRRGRHRAAGPAAAGLKANRKALTSFKGALVMMILVTAISSIGGHFGALAPSGRLGRYGRKSRPSYSVCTNGRARRIGCGVPGRRQWRARNGRPRLVRGDEPGGAPGMLRAADAPVGALDRDQPYRADRHLDDHL